MTRYSVSRQGVQLVVPMAGVGSRFAQAGYRELKPLIPVFGEPMIAQVIRNLSSESIANVVLVCRRETMQTVNLRKALDFLRCPLTILAVDATTTGPASTVLTAYPALDLSLPLVVANSDQFLNADLEDFYRALQDGDSDGIILTMNDADPKWSFVRKDEDGNAIEVAEKQAISTEATVGVYGFSRAQLAFDAIGEMVKAGDRTNGEFYVAPAYNYLIQRGARIATRNLGPVSTVMWGLGTPEDLEHFIEVGPLSSKG